MVGFWISLNSFGISAWRLLSTYVTLAAAIYFLLSALILAISRKRNAGQLPCPMFEGMLIITFSLLCVTAMVYHLQGLNFPGASGWHASLIYFVLSFLVLSDWVLFTKKGQWRLVDPFYWLSPAIIYASLIILTAIQFPASDPLRYPVSILNFYDNGLVEMLLWIALIAVMMLIFGYILILIDAATSGKIAKYIVLPRIKTIVLDEDEPAPEPVKPEPKIERIEVKLEPMEPQARRTGSKNKKAKAANAGKKPARQQPQRNSKTKNTDGIKSTNRPKKHGENNKNRKNSPKTNAPNQL